MLGSEALQRQMTGVEIPITLLFSDIRGSTGLGERMRPADFHTLGQDHPVPDRRVETQSVG